MSCGNYCDTIVSGTVNEQWAALQEKFGANGETFADEYAAWQIWSSAHPSSDATWFTWLRWKYTYGTENYGNLPSYKKSEHTGNCFTPCPYSIQATDIGSTIMLGGIPAGALTKNDHVINERVYYMRVAANGSVWGYECTFDNCPYYTVYGKRYFYV
jgi:hypothetical protein